MAFKSGSYQQLTTIPTSPHDDLYMFLDSSQNGVFDSDTGITSSVTAPTRINRGWQFRFQAAPYMAMGQDRLVISQSERGGVGNDSDYLFHIYNLNYFNNLTDSGIISVSSDSSLSELSASIQNGETADYGLLTTCLSGDFATGGTQEGHNIANNRIVHSGSRPNDNIGMAGIYDLKGQLIKLLYKDNVSDPNTNGYFGRSSDVGSGRIVVSDLYYLDSVGDSIGAAFLYDLNGNFIKTMRPPIYANIDSDNEGKASKGYYKPRELFGENVNISGANILVAQPSANRPYHPISGVVHMYDLNGTYKKTIKSYRLSGTKYFGERMHAKDGIIAIESYQDFPDSNPESYLSGYGRQIEVFNNDGDFIGNTRSNPGKRSNGGSTGDRDFISPKISDGKIFVTVPQNFMTNVSAVAMIKRDAGQSTNNCQITTHGDVIEPPENLQDSWEAGQSFGSSFVVDNGRLAIAAEVRTAYNSLGVMDSFGGVYLYEFPKQKNLTNLLDDF